MLLTAAAISSVAARAEDAAVATGTVPAPVAIDKRVFGVLPNYRTADGSLPYEPISVRQKYGIGLRDSSDKPVYLLAGFYAGINQIYYPESRTASSNIQKLGIQIGTDAVANVLQEIWPDVKRRLFRKKTPA